MGRLRLVSQVVPGSHLWGDSSFHRLSPAPAPICEATHDSHQVVPGSHLWGDSGAPVDFGYFDQNALSPANPQGLVPGAKHELYFKPVTMPPGSLMLMAAGTFHRGGANNTTNDRLVVAPQYCACWARVQENTLLGTSFAKTLLCLDSRVRDLMGYNITFPFMGHVDGRHPEKRLEKLAKTEELSKAEKRGRAEELGGKLTKAEERGNIGGGGKRSTKARL